MKGEDGRYYVDCVEVAATLVSKRLYVHDLMMNLRFRVLLAVLFASGLLLGALARASAEAANIVLRLARPRSSVRMAPCAKAERGAAVDAGEMVDTGDGKVQLRFRDGATISLQPGTRFRVEQFRFAGQNGRADDEDKVVMRFLKGALRAISGLIGHERHEQYRMETAVGTIGIRGTAYGASLDDKGLTLTTYAGRWKFAIRVAAHGGCRANTLCRRFRRQAETLQASGGSQAGQGGLMPGAGQPDLPAVQLQQGLPAGGQPQGRRNRPTVATRRR